jgi:hypothetical protein
MAAYLGGTLYTEPLLALFGAGGFYALDQWRRGRGPGWLVAAGALAGTAASTKYLALFCVLTLAVAAAWIGARRGGRAGVRASATFALGAAAGSVIAYVRILAYTGNPVFPFCSWLFGANPWDAAAFYSQQTLTQRITLLWTMAFDPAAVGNMPAFSPVLPLAVPLLLWRAWADRGVRALLAAALAYVAVTPAHARYFTVVAPLFCLAIASALPSIDRTARRLTVPLAAALLLPGWFYAAGLCKWYGPPPVTRAERDRFVAGQVPLYPAVRYLEEQHPGDTTYGYGAEQMVAFAAGRWLGDWNGPAAYDRLEVVAPDTGRLARWLTERGVRHLLISRRTALADLPGRADFAAHFTVEYTDAAALVLGVAP